MSEAPDQSRPQVDLDVSAIMRGVQGELNDMMRRMRDPYAAALHEANRPRPEQCVPHGFSYCTICKRQRRWSWAQHVVARDFKTAEKARVTPDEARFIADRCVARLIVAGLAQ